jgi:hypothetical protein
MPQRQKPDRPAETRSLPAVEAVISLPLQFRLMAAFVDFVDFAR